MTEPNGDEQRLIRQIKRMHDKAVTSAFISLFNKRNANVSPRIAHILVKRVDPIAIADAFESALSKFEVYTGRRSLISRINEPLLREIILGAHPKKTRVFFSTLEDQSSSIKTGTRQAISRFADELNMMLGNVSHEQLRYVINNCFSFAIRQDLLADYARDALKEEALELIESGQSLKKEAQMELASHPDKDVRKALLAERSNFHPTVQAHLLLDPVDAIGHEIAQGPGAARALVRALGRQPWS